MPRQEDKTKERKLSSREVKSTEQRAQIIDHFLETIEALIETGRPDKALIEVKKVRRALSMWKEWK